MIGSLIKRSWEPVRTTVHDFHLRFPFFDSSSDRERVPTLVIFNVTSWAGAPRVGVDDSMPVDVFRLPGKVTWIMVALAND